jgi:hypothetical protein
MRLQLLEVRTRFPSAPLPAPLTRKKSNNSNEKEEVEGQQLQKK